MKSIYIIILFLSINLIHAQDKFITKQGEISFFSSTPIEDIKADNTQVLSVIDTNGGKIGIIMSMKLFKFDKSLMEEHFNENYVESNEYPKAKFKGEIINFNTLKKGKNNVTVKGDITIHGVTKPIEIKSKLTKNKDVISMTGKFEVAVADFNIKIPTLVFTNIAEKIEVTFNLNHNKYSK